MCLCLVPPRVGDGTGWYVYIAPPPPLLLSQGHDSTLAVMGCDIPPFQTGIVSKQF